MIALIILGISFYRMMATDKIPIKHNVGNSVMDTLSENADNGFRRVMAPRPFSFPIDHGPHNDYRAEWWYFTGNVDTREGRKFGYELTFFRFALTPEENRSPSAWRTNQLYMAHFALTDAAANDFHAFERFSRGAARLAGSSSERLNVWLYDWSISPVDGEDFPVRLKAASNDIAIDLTLTATKPVVLQGKRGFSQKSSEPGQASHYYSYTRLPTTGTIRVGTSKYRVEGASWMDREWSTSALSAQQAGWDWFALQLSSGDDLMFYRFRRKDGQPDRYSAGTLVDERGATVPLQYNDVSIQELETWKSPRSGAVYPSKWRLIVPKHRLELALVPLIPNQELDVAFKYWEGAVSIKGVYKGQAVSGRGYVELTGYIEQSFVNLLKVN